jgi:hypothetical protein
MRFPALIGLLIVVPLGFGLKYYSGPGFSWCNLHGAGVLYEVFWCLVAFFFFPGRKSIPYIAAVVFVGTCVLEFLQLWHPPLLELVRSFHVGAWLIGNGFDWFDFPHYAIGCGLGYLIMKKMLDAGRLTQAENKKNV